MNQKFLRIFVTDMEVGAAYTETINNILQNPVLSEFKYILTLEHDNLPPPDGILKLYENMDKFDVIGGIYYTKGPGGMPMCFDDKTEVLTKDGWKFFKDVEYTDYIATLNNLGFIEYHNPLDKQVYSYEGEMLHWQAQRFDIMVTPEHSLYCSKRTKKKAYMNPFDRYKASEMYNASRIRFKRNANWEGIEQDLFYITPERPVKMDLWLQFLGYYISEGCCPNSKNNPTSKLVDIRQCKMHTYERIAEICDKLNFDTKRKEGRVQFNDKEVRDILMPLGKAVDKHAPKYIHSLSTRQIQIFLDALWEGDGHTKNGKKENYHSKSKQLADDVQELLLKTGLVGTIGSKQYWNNTEKAYNTMYVVSTSHSSFYPIVKKKAEKVQYKGIVYDLTVPNHTLYIRRNGKAIWSGNCYGSATEYPVNFIPFEPTPNSIQPCRGLGMGFTLFKMEIFKNPALPKPFFETVQSYKEGVGAQAYTQDLKFFENAGKLGYKMACDSRVKVGHMDMDGDNFIW